VNLHEKRDLLKSGGRDWQVLDGGDERGTLPENAIVLFEHLEKKPDKWRCRKGCKNNGIR